MQQAKAKTPDQGNRAASKAHSPQSITASKSAGPGREEQPRRAVTPRHFDLKCEPVTFACLVEPIIALLRRTFIGAPPGHLTRLPISLRSRFPRYQGVFGLCGTTEAPLLNAPLVHFTALNPPCSYQPIEVRIERLRGLELSTVTFWHALSIEMRPKSRVTFRKVLDELESMRWKLDSLIESFDGDFALPPDETWVFSRFEIDPKES